MKFKIFISISIFFILVISVLSFLFNFNKDYFNNLFGRNEESSVASAGEQDDDDYNSETFGIEFSDLYDNELLVQENYNSEKKCYNISSYCVSISAIEEITENDTNYYYVAVSGEAVGDTPRNFINMMQFFKLKKIENSDGYHYEIVAESEEFQFGNINSVELIKINKNNLHTWVVNSYANAMGGAMYLANSFFLPVKNSKIKHILTIHEEATEPETNVCNQNSEDSPDSEIDGNNKEGSSPTEIANNNANDSDDCSWHDSSTSAYNIIENKKGYYDISVYTTSISKLDGKEVEEETKALYYFDKKLEEFVEK